MEALRTIGIGKALRFLGYTVLGKLLHWCIVPQVRSTVLGIAGARIGGDTVILDASFANLYHHGFGNLILGNRCFIGDEVMLDLRGKIALGDSVTLSNRCSIITHINVGYPDHPLQKVYPTKEDRVTIEQGVYVGTGAIILPGVRVGRESVVGAGAVVTHDVQPHTVVAGVPAKVIKRFRP